MTAPTPQEIRDAIAEGLPETPIEQFADTVAILMLTNARIFNCRYAIIRPRKMWPKLKWPIARILQLDVELSSRGFKVWNFVFWLIVYP